MRDYAKVSPQFWIGETGKKLRKAGAEAQVVALYLMTCPHANMIGMYYLPVMYLAHETGIGMEGASKGLQSAIEAGICSYDEASEIVWVHEMARYQIADQLAETDKRCKGVQNEYDAVPENPFLAGFFDKYKVSFHMTKKRGSGGERASPIEAPSEPLGSQEQEQEQEQEHTSAYAEASGSVASPTRAPSCPHREIIDLYHEILPMGTQVRVWNSTRAKALQARWREDAKRQDLDWWRKFFTYVSESDFLTGRTQGSPGRDPFVVSLDWLIAPQNFAKAIEGKYENRSAA